MKEKELRLSLVCYGGVSLAVYMHGVVEEILKLTRASKIFHQPNVNTPGREDSYDNLRPNPPYETDTERLYFELLKALKPKMELRVIVDTISGASAGGINGIFLARAIAHDLSMTPQRKMWIELADVLKLMDKQTIASKWSKFYLYPVLLIFGWERLRKYFPNNEIRRKASIFLRSRWLEPPFSGNIMLGWMLDAGYAQGLSSKENVEECDSLMPTSQRLELMVSLTNFYGKQQTIALNDPAEISEREHRSTLLFKYYRHENGKVESDFTDDNIPGLAFAARATSSFPGAFPPANLHELKQTLEEREQDWPAQAQFMARNRHQFHDHGASPDCIHFIDGSVVNNKPFGEVIAALHERPAYRQVDRRIIYIDPKPDKLTAEDNTKPPGFFHTIFDAVVQIPGNEPIRDELQKLGEHNRRARRLQSVMASLKADIEPFFENLVTRETIQHISTPLMASWREKVNSEAVSEAGYAYSSYLYIKLYYLIESITRHLSDESFRAKAMSDPNIRAAILSWARSTNIWSGGTDSMDKLDRLAIIHILRGMDVDFRIRRLRFVIKYVNESYRSFGENCDNFDDIHHLNGLKKLAYQYIEYFKSCWSAPSPITSADDVASSEQIKQLTKTIIDRWDLEGKDLDFDDAFCDLINNICDASLRLEIVRGYIGFPFYDVLTLPLLQTTDLTEIDTISVNRISPDDRSSIPWEKEEGMLQGTSFGNFGAFFQRGARENDHIWGRLQSSERLVDFIIDSAGASNLPSDFDVTAFKKRLFQTILEAEKPHIKAGIAEFELIKTLVEAIN